MKWYKKQLDALKSAKSKPSEPDAKGYLEKAKSPMPRKIAKPGEKRSRPKTDSK